MVRSDGRVRYTISIEQRRPCNLIEYLHVIELVCQTRSDQHLVEYVPIICDRLAACRIIMSSGRAFRTLSEEPPHRIVKELAIFAVNNTAVRAGNTGRHNGVQPL